MQWLPQTLLLGWAVLLALWVQGPMATVAGIGVLWIALLAPEAMPVQKRESLGAARLAVAWAASVTVALSLVTWGFCYGAAVVRPPSGAFTWNFYFALAVWLIAAAVWRTQRRMADGAAKARWKSLVMAWLLCGALMWLGGGYFQNRRGDFYAGLLATLALLVLWRVWFRLGAVGAQTVHVLILLLVGLPAADLLTQSLTRPALRPETCQLYYSYDAAKGDPGAFRRWREFFNDHFARLIHDCFEPAPNSLLLFRLRPNSHGFFVNCPISINSLGFRGREFPLDKGRAYRIVALGESTTFGMTLQPGEKPWPELLEQIIRDRLKPRRPVEVINAGIPSYSINGNLWRLPRDILPLKPDLLLSYHGANGFSLIDNSVLPPLGPPAPLYQERPLRLAAQAEHRVRMWLYRRRVARRGVLAVPSSAKPLDTEYAAAYRRLIQCARTNRIRLALANYSMAVNARSQQSVIDFYRVDDAGAGNTDAQLRANVVHSLIVQQLAAQHPEVCLVDTHPHLDGEHEKFIDLVHLTQEGRRQLAENMFAALRNMLLEDLGQP